MIAVAGGEVRGNKMSEKRTPIGRFIHCSWTNMNIRAGKYRHLGSKNKNRCYEGICIEFTRNEYKDWCLMNKDKILSLDCPSVDRIDSSKNYNLENIQIINLIENIKKKRYGNSYFNGPLENSTRGIRSARNGKWSARITVNKKEKYLGMFQSKEEALDAFSNAYFEVYNRLPFK